MLDEENERERETERGQLLLSLSLLRNDRAAKLWDKQAGDFVHTYSRCSGRNGLPN